MEGPVLSQDGEAARAFLARGPVFVCTLVPPQPDDARRSAMLVFALQTPHEADAFSAALDFARHALGRNHALVMERVALGPLSWPSEEPRPAAQFVVEREGYVLLAPSVIGRVHMPPAQPHLLMQLLAAWPRESEAAARKTLDEQSHCAMLARVRAVLLGDSGAELDAVVGDAQGLRAGYFAPPPRQVPSSEPDAALKRSTATPPTDRAPPLESSRKPGLDPAVTACADDFLWAQSPRVVWSEPFEQRFRAHLSERHPELTGATLDALVAYGKWLCWHEGL